MFSEVPEVGVYGLGGFPAVGKGTDYETGTVGCVSGYEYVGGKLRLLRFQEAHCQKHQVVYSTTGHCGQGVASLCPTGGCGMISICVTLAAP